MNKVAIEVAGLAKAYQIGGLHQSYYRLTNQLADLFMAPFRRVGKLLRGGGQVATSGRWGLPVCLPDVYQAGRGRSLDSARLISIGVVPDLVRRGVGVTMARHLMRNLLANGYQTLEGSWVRACNVAPQKLARRFAARPGRLCVLYEKELRGTNL